MVIKINTEKQVPVGVEPKDAKYSAVYAVLLPDGKLAASRYIRLNDEGFIRIHEGSISYTPWPAFGRTELLVPVPTTITIIG